MFKDRNESAQSKKLLQERQQLEESIRHLTREMERLRREVRLSEERLEEERRRSTEALRKSQVEAGLARVAAKSSDSERYQARMAQNAAAVAKQQAEEEANKAQSAAQDALKERTIAQDALRQAQVAVEEAERERGRALEATSAAERAMKEAEQAKREAEGALILAQAEKKRTEEALERASIESARAQEATEANSRAAAQEREATRVLQEKVENILLVVGAASEGDLTQLIPVQGRDSIGQLGEGLVRFFAALKSSLTSVQSQSKRLLGSAQGLYSESERLNEAAQSSEAKTRQARELMEGIMTRVQEATQSAGRVDQGMHGVSDNTLKGVKHTQEAVILSESARKVILSLGGKCNEINSILEMIERVSHQTKLLALNARIEAALAGQAGQGFAVVAREIKALAEETANATTQISEKIVSLQRGAHEAQLSIGGVNAVIQELSKISLEIEGTVKRQRQDTAKMSQDLAVVATATQTVGKNIEDVGRLSAATLEIAQGTRGF